MTKTPPTQARLFARHHRGNPKGAVYIGRGTPWGNPFIIGRHGTRGEVIERFKREILPDLDLSELRGKHLVCHCAPLPCHGDTILWALGSKNYVTPEDARGEPPKATLNADGQWEIPF